MLQEILKMKQQAVENFNRALDIQAEIKALLVKHGADKELLDLFQESIEISSAYSMTIEELCKSEHVMRTAIELEKQLK